eukprot:6197219-Pleurochrysis_carterae.AAC.1
MYYPKQGAIGIACEESALRVRERGACPALQEKSAIARATPSGKSWVDILDEEKPKRTERGGEKTEERDGDGGAGARASVATVYARQTGRLPLPTLTSDCRAIRHVADSRFLLEAICTEISISPPPRRPAVSAHAQPLGYKVPLATLHCPCIAGCKLTCAPGIMRTDETVGVLFEFR